MVYLPLIVVISRLGTSQSLQKCCIEDGIPFVAV